MTGERWTPAYDRLFDPDHELRGDPACRALAWLDLCHMAQYRNGAKPLGATVVPLAQGELVASYRFLARRWRWSVKKVRTFLEFLTSSEVKKLTAVRETPKGTVYRIATYGDWANPGTPEGTGRGTAPTPSRGTEKGTGGSVAAQGVRENRGTGEDTGGGPQGAQQGHKAQQVTSSSTSFVDRSNETTRSGHPLADLFAEYPEALDRLIDLPGFDHPVACSFVARFIDSPSAERTWRKIDPERIPYLLAEAVHQFCEQKSEAPVRWSALQFSRFVDVVADQERRGAAAVGGAVDESDRKRKRLLELGEDGLAEIRRQRERVGSNA